MIALYVANAWQFSDLETPKMKTSVYVRILLLIEVLFFENSYTKKLSLSQVSNFSRQINIENILEEVNSLAPVYTIPFLFHVGLVSYRVGLLCTREHTSLMRFILFLPFQMKTL